MTPETRALFCLKPWTALAATLMVCAPLRAAEPWPAQSSAELVLNRLAFGPRPGEVKRLAASGPKGLRAWIEAQLNPEAIPDAAVDAKLAKIPSLKLSVEELLKAYPRPEDILKMNGVDLKNLSEDKKKELRKEMRDKMGADHLPDRLIEEITAAKLIRAVESERQLQEVLVDFWFNHFNVDANKNDTKWLIAPYERDAIRAHVFGKFRDLLGATAHHPAMLTYLDNRLSEKEPSPEDKARFEKNNRPVKGLNENYGRELLELHTLGVDGGYTQDDVREVARALTGWSVGDRDKDALKFVFKDRLHDNGEKHILGHTLPPNGGESDGETVLDIVSAHPATSRFIARKLCERFVSDRPPRALVERVAKKFRDSQGDLKQVYRAIFLSPEFRAKSNLHAKVKTPFRFIVSSVRALGGELDDKTQIPRDLNQMGEQLYRCAPPTGYKDVSEAWVNPGALVARLNFGLALAGNKVNGAYVELPQIHLKRDAPQEILGRVAYELGLDRLSKPTRDTILKELSSERQIMADGEVRPMSIAKIVGLLLGSPEFQRN